MSSRSDNQHSSSSPYTHRKDGRDDRSRSRSKGHRRRQERNEYRHKGSSKRRIIKVPELSGELVNFQTFMSKQDEKVSIDKARQEYENYKRDWEEKYNQAFLNDHKNDAWFREKYDPQFLEIIEKERKENVIILAKKFFKQFEEGYYDKIDLRIKDANRLGQVYNTNDREEDLDQCKDFGQHKPTSVPVSNQTLQIIVMPSNDLAESPLFAFSPDENTIFIKAIPRTISKFDIYQTVQKLPGFHSLTLSEPVKKLSFARYCWVTFSDAEAFNKAEMAMSGLLIKEQPINFGRSLTKNKKIRVLKNYPAGRVHTDAEVCQRLAKKLDQQCSIQDNPIFKHTFASSQQKFDTLLLYLRRVHAYDYYTGTSHINERALCLKLGVIYLRIEAQYEEMENFSTIFKKIQQAAQNRIQRGSQTPDYMGILREEIEKMIKKNILQTEDITEQALIEKTAWQCFYCKKKFKTCEFLAKHMISKHPEPKETKIQALMEIAYRKDANKLTNYPISREDRQNMKGRRMNFRRERRREYKDFDEPEGQAEKTYAKPLVNFLDI